MSSIANDRAVLTRAPSKRELKERGDLSAIVWFAVVMVALTAVLVAALGGSLMQDGPTTIFEQSNFP